jgi:aspartate carbamoyltransferase
MSNNIKTMTTRHLISVDSISKSQILSYINLAEEFRSNLDKSHPLSVNKFALMSNQFPDKTLITMFYEPSTRTNCSFQAAAIKLGCKVIALTEKQSSSEKGESLEDTIRTLQYYGDAIVLRHPANGSARLAAAVSRVPIINGGDGNGEHPTQALLDIFTIHSELEQRNIYLDSENRPPITITFVGDLKNSRTVHSLIRVLTHFPNLRFVYVSPPSLKMPAEIVDYVSSFQRYEQIIENTVKDTFSHETPSGRFAGESFNSYAIPSGSLRNCPIYNTDVLYMTRIQKERFTSDEEYIRVMKEPELYSVTPDILQYSKETMIVMHPLPRLNEIPVEIDSDKKSVYFRQVENGLYMRMAILCKMFRR